MSEVRIHVIGIEPGVPGLSPAGRSAADSCALLAGASRHLDLLPEFSGDRYDMAHGLSPLLERLEAEPSLRAAVLASGDPGFFGVAALLLRRFPREQLRIHPAVSSLQLAFARAGETWSDARFASLHGRVLENLAAVLGAPRIGLFTDGTNDPPAIARFLLDTGWDDLEMVVAEELGLTGERLTRGAPREFLEWRGSDLNVVLLLRPGPDPRPVGPGLPEEVFCHSRGLITKAEVRAVALGLLRLPRQGVLWDVGAGSGSLGVEACLAVPGLCTYAIEKTDDGLEHIRENRRRFRVAALVPVCGVAPEVLAGLPAPDSVFIGGSGGNLAVVLDACRTRLRPGGTMVVSAVLTETLGEALAWCRERGVQASFREVGAARSRQVAGRHRLEPQNPVTLVQVVVPHVGDGQ